VMILMVATFRSMTRFCFRVEKAQDTMLTMRFKLDMKQRCHSGPSHIQTYRSVGCMAISGVCLVFPNDGAGSEDMLVLYPIQEWSDRFHTSDAW
jgi:hypothetical protein